MPVRVTLDRLIAERGLKARDLARTIGLSETQLSLFRSGKVKGVRFETLARMCAALGCRPGDLLDYAWDPADFAVAATEGGAEAEQPEA